MKNFRYVLPKQLTEVFELFSASAEKRNIIMAGGTDLLVRMKAGHIVPDCIVDLKGIPGLGSITYDQYTGLSIGALSTISNILKFQPLPPEYASLVDAASVLGSPQIRNKGTIGGNLCNASPSADLAPPLIVMEATLEITCAKGKKVFLVENFFKGPGQTVLESGEILSKIVIPKLPPQSATTYMKLGRRKGMDLAIVGIACFMAVNGKSFCTQARIAMGAVAATPTRAREAEKALIGKKIDLNVIEDAAENAASEARPISDLRATAEYRKEMVKVLVRRAIRESLRKLALEV